MSALQNTLTPEIARKVWDYIDSFGGVEAAIDELANRNEAGHFTAVLRVLRSIRRLPANQQQVRIEELRVFGMKERS